MQTCTYAAYYLPILIVCQSMSKLVVGKALDNPLS